MEEGAISLGEQHESDKALILGPLSTPIRAFSMLVMTVRASDGLRGAGRTWQVKERLQG